MFAYAGCCARLPVAAGLVGYAYHWAFGDARRSRWAKRSGRSDPLHSADFPAANSAAVGFDNVLWRNPRGASLDHRGNRMVPLGVECGYSLSLGYGFGVSGERFSAGDVLAASFTLSGRNRSGPCFGKVIADESGAAVMPIFRRRLILAFSRNRATSNLRSFSIACAIEVAP